MLFFVLILQKESLLSLPFLIITLDASDVGEHKVTLTPEGCLKFSGKATTKTYEVEIHLNGEVDVE